MNEENTTPENNDVKSGAGSVEETADTVENGDTASAAETADTAAAAQTDTEPSEGDPAAETAETNTAEVSDAEGGGETDAVDEADDETDDFDPIPQHEDSAETIEIEETTDEPPLSKREKKKLERQAKKERKAAEKVASGDGTEGESDGKTAFGKFKSFVTGKRFLMTVGITFGVLAAIYLAGVAFYQNRFLFSTRINGNGCSNMTMEQAAEKIKYNVENYVFDIYGHNEMHESVTGEEVELQLDAMGSLEEAKAQQNPWLWCFKYDNRKLPLDITLTLNEEKLRAALAEFDVVKQSDANIEGEYANVYFGGGNEYYIDNVPGKEFIDFELFVEKTIGGMEGMYDSMNLDEEGIYVGIAKENHIKRLLENMDKYVGTKIVYVNGEETYTLDAATIHDWLTPGEDYEAWLDDSAVAEWTAKLAEHYNTIGKDRSFVTSNGEEITIGGGDYGWKVDIDTESADLSALIRSGAQETDRLPAFSQTAASLGSIDIGNTYVEVSISDQHVWMYKDGECIVSTSTVTGDTTKGNGTTPGVYSIMYKERNATLVGQGYSSPVSFWMPFNGGQGLHDATWRGSFGGSIYRGSGSHGCVNLPYSAAAAIYDAIEKGDPVIVY